MSIYTQAEAKAILEKALAYSKADGCEINIYGNTTGNIRYARNTVSTAGVNSNIELAVQSNFGKKVGTATINEFDADSLAKVVARSEELARLSPESPEFMAPLGPQQYDASKSYSQATANITPEFRAAVASSSIEPAKAKKVTAAGYLEDGAGFSAMANKKGLFAYEKDTSLDFTVTMRSDDGTGSGWVTRDFNDVRKFNPEEAST